MSLRTGVAERKEIFFRIVELQDAGMSVPRSRDKVSLQYGKTIYFLKQIEEEGINRNWLDRGEREVRWEDNRQALADKWAQRLKEGRTP